MQATPLLPGKPFLGDDEPTNKEVNEQARGCRKVDLMGYQTSQFGIDYHPRTAIKAQALTYFIAEFTIPDEEGAPNEAERWMIQTNGSSARKRGGVGVIIITP